MVPLSDLVGFRISDQRWFAFQSMGPAPRARSGHTMATIGSKIFVLGGEGWDSPLDDPRVVHILAHGEYLALVENAKTS